MIEALGAAPGGGKYFFWTRETKAESATKNWEKCPKRLFCLPGMPEGHAHRFRDTFAVDMLLAVVPIDGVSKLLGHFSLKVT